MIKVTFPLTEILKSTVKNGDSATATVKNDPEIYILVDSEIRKFELSNGDSVPYHLSNVATFKYIRTQMFDLD